VADAPGFSRIDLQDIPSQELPNLMPDFLPHAEGCRFRGCSHSGEPGCAVSVAVEAGEIDAGRYERYTAYLQEVRRAETTRW
jgi:ribosome biogenesis GTPase